MKKSTLTIVFLLATLLASESFAQRFNRYRRYSPPPRLQVIVPRVIVPPVVRLYSPRVIITTPPLFFGGGRSIQNYYRRGYSSRSRWNNAYDYNYGKRYNYHRRYNRRR